MLVMDREPSVQGGDDMHKPIGDLLLADGDDPRELVHVAKFPFTKAAQLRDDVTWLKDGKFGILSSSGSNAHIDVHSLPRTLLASGEFGPSHINVTCMTDLGFVTIDSVLGIQSPELPDLPTATPQQAREIVYSAVQQILVNRTEAQQVAA